MISPADLIVAQGRMRNRSEKVMIEDTLFPQQDYFIKDMNRFVCAQTTVRAGKSTGLSLKYFRAGHKYKNVMMPYIALTKDSAKNIMWPILQEVSERFKILCDFNKSDYTCIIKETGSSIKLFGADTENFIVRIKGIKTPLAAVDEGQDFRSHLEELIDILTARTSEYADGQVALTGTPGPVPKGYFYEASKGLHGFSTHHWSLFDNPYFPTARQFVMELQERKKWSSNHPTLLREFYGQWVQDLEALVFNYDVQRNHYDVAPLLTDYVIGVDFGTDDADAIAVIGWHKNSRQAYLVDEFVKSGLTVTEIVKEVESRMVKYKPLKIVADTGANGKKIALEISKRTGTPVNAAEKQRKIEHITWLNDALRTGLFYARSTSRFASDCSVVEWDYDKSTSDKLVIKDEPHSDICDAVLYAYVEALHWLSEPAPVKVNIKDQWVKYSKQMADDAIENKIQQQQEEERENDFYATSAMDGEQEVLRHYLNKRRG